MRIVALADTHMFHNELIVPEGDVLVHAGDLCRGGDLRQLEEALGWVKQWNHPTKIVVAGNHDWAFVRNRQSALELCGEEIVYLEDSGVEVGGIRWWGSPWQPEFNNWAFNLRRGAALASKWALIPQGVDVLVTHGPPAGMGDRSSIGGRQGCEDLKRRVAAIRPKLHLFGHIHEDGGAWSHEGVCYANVTTWECERCATVIDLDVGSGGVAIRAAPPARR